MGLYVAQAEHHQRFAGLVFGGQPDLVAGQLQDDVVHRSAGWKAQRAPIDGDRAAADAEESTEVDDGCPNLAGALHDHIDNASHVFIGSAVYILAENALSVAIVDDRGRSPILGVFV